MLSNYPDGLSDSTPGAPWNDPYIPEKDFEVTCCQVLSRTAIVTTNNYIPGASGVDYESDGEGGTCACGWQDDDETSNTNWSDEYEGNGYKTPLQLIQLFKETLKQQLKSWEGLEDTPAGKKEIRKIEHLIEECDCWQDDETEYTL